MRLQFVSDLHLETRPKQTFEQLLDVGKTTTLALLGDIAPLAHPNLRPFLEWCSERWETILYVPGKTELLTDASISVGTAVQRLRDMCTSYQNIHVLYRDTFYTDDGLIVLGCPYWSLAPNESPDLKKLHKEDFAWIQASTRTYRNPCVVLTHFGPLPWTQTQFGLLDPSHTTQFPHIELILKDPIVVWIFGHIHDTVETSKVWNNAGGDAKTILLLANGLGFLDKADPIPEWYRKDAIVRVDPSVY